MKVILVNGSPHEKGCTYTALKEVASALEQEGIETDIFWSDNFFYGQSFLYCRLFRSENFLSEAGGRGGICPPCGNDGSL